RLTSFCAGLVDQDDPDLFFTAVREAKEECGYQVTDLELLSKPGPTSSGLSDETTAIVLARAIKKEETHLEEIEDIETFFVPLSKADEILDDPERTVPVNVRMIVKYLQQYWKGNKIHETRID
ncbi:MAG: NUDIX hydrolase, partial [Candidatus Enterosoma sp.]|nr:NUDIX hydrolase [Candidatus Enterosoma sp.]